MGKWKFRKMDKSEKLVDPIQSQFFSTNIVGGLTSALVRETIQNSLDAKTEDDEETDSCYPVEVRFVLSGHKNAIPPEKSATYFEGLIPHIQADGNGLPESNIPDFSGSMPYLLIEDYNTVGLEGDPLESDDPSKDNDAKHNFFWFWRNVGRSEKGHDKRGRWGLGKAVYPKCSNIHTYFGLTTRESDDRTLLMGESILQIHKLDDEAKKSYPYGYYGEFIDKEDECFVSPLEDNDAVEDFVSDFRLIRTEEEDSGYCYGLSLIIPFPSEEITRSELVKATVLQYFYPIIHGELIVKIEDEDTDEPILIDAENIDSVIDEIEFDWTDSHDGEKLGKLFHFARWVFGCDEDEFITLLEPDMGYAPQWKKDMYLNEELRTKLDHKIEQFDLGQPVAFNVPVKVHRIGSAPKIAWFKVYLEKDRALYNPDIHYIRDGITIVGVNQLKRKDIRALVVIHESLLSDLLGDAENPAHTEWSGDSPNFVGKYEQGDSVISFVINSVDRLNNWLMKPPEGLDKDILEDIFYIEEEVDPDTGTGGGNEEEGGGGTEEVDPPPGRKPSPVLVQKKNGGFGIVPNPKSEDLPDIISVKLGYVVPRGNPIKGYSKLDFDLSVPPIIVTSTGVTILNQKENELEFEITEPDNFKVKVTGFDLERDLSVKVD